MPRNHQSSRDRDYGESHWDSDRGSRGTRDRADRKQPSRRLRSSRYDDGDEDDDDDLDREGSRSSRSGYRPNRSRSYPDDDYHDKGSSNKDKQIAKYRSTRHSKKREEEESEEDESEEEAEVDAIPASSNSQRIHLAPVINVAATDSGAKYVNENIELKARALFLEKQLEESRTRSNATANDQGSPRDRDTKSILGPFQQLALTQSSDLESLPGGASASKFALEKGSRASQQGQAMNEDSFWSRISRTQNHSNSIDTSLLVRWKGMGETERITKVELMSWFVGMDWYAMFCSLLTMWPSRMLRFYVAFNLWCRDAIDSYEYDDRILQIYAGQEGALWFLNSPQSMEELLIRQARVAAHMCVVYLDTTGTINNALMEEMIDEEESRIFVIARRNPRYPPCSAARPLFLGRRRLFW